MKDFRKQAWWKTFGLDSYFNEKGAKPFIELCVLASMVAAGADGSASADEYDHIVSLVTLATNGTADRDALDDLVNKAVRQLEQERGMDALIEDVSDRATAGAGVRKAALAFSVACSAADGDVSEEELEQLKALAAALKLPDELSSIRQTIAAG